MSGGGPAVPVRIAMWSGPRTVSTALMRAWENRPDTVVADEPLYSFYLHRTGLAHPGRDQVIASQPTEWRVVLAQLTSAPLPDGAVISYAKHMTHHLLPEVDRAAFAPLRHAHLIRDPRELLASYARVRTEPTLADLGLAQQAEIFETFGGPVVDSADLLADPEGTLRALCGALDVPFDARMLSWPPGPRDSDGVWAPYWYDSVRASTGFAPHRPKAEPLPARLEPLAEKCMPYYTQLHRYRLTSPLASQRGAAPPGLRSPLASQRGAALPGLRSEERATREGSALKAPRRRARQQSGKAAPEGAPEARGNTCKPLMSVTVTSSSTWAASSPTATGPR